MRAHRFLIASALAMTAAFGLAACSTSEAPGPSKSPSASSNTPRAAETVYNECIDGAAQIWNEEGQTKNELDDCKGVNVISSDAAITLGKVEVLTVEGSKTTITVSGLTELALTGNDNTIRYSGDAPKVTDEGSGNKIEAAS